MPSYCELDGGEVLDHLSPTAFARALACHCLGARLLRLDPTDVGLRIVSEEKKRGDCHGLEKKVYGFVYRPTNGRTYVTAEQGERNRMETILHELRHHWQTERSSHNWTDQAEREADAEGFATRYWPALRSYVKKTLRHAGRRWEEEHPPGEPQRLQEDLSYAAQAILWRGDTDLEYADNRLFGTARAPTDPDRLKEIASGVVDQMTNGCGCG